MKNMIMAFAAMFALAGCSDNGSADSSQDNTSSTRRSGDSSSPSVENSGATNPNTLNSVGNGNMSGDSNHTSAARIDSMMNGSALSQDTTIHNKPKK